MATFDIGIWITADLASNGPGDPVTALDRFVTETFDEMGHTADLTIHDDHPNPPRESVSLPEHWPANDDPCPNLEGHPETFDNLLDWWNLWHACNGQIHDDANVLVSNFDSTAGVTTGDCDDAANHRCVAEGHDIGRLADEDIDNAGPDDRYSQMYATVLHEIGHAVIDETESVPCSNSISEERMGDSWRNQDFNITFTTPMVTWANNGADNECCTDLVAEPSTPYWTRSYSTCVQNHVTNCANKY